MRHGKIIRILGVAILMCVTLTAMVAAPALAQKEITVDPSEGKIGQTVTITGTGFSASTDTADRYVDIYFSSDLASLGNSIDNQVTTYKKWFEAQWVDTDGNFELTRTVPTQMTDGSTDADVQAGQTYYIYVTAEYTMTPAPLLIRAKATFAVTASAALNALSPASGPAGASVTVSGANFSVSYPIIFKFDTTTITPASGDVNTSTSGGFSSIITVPSSSTAGAHTISVTVGTNTVTATFTVTASAALNALLPASGPAGTDVTISGANFLVSYPIIFKFDTTTITPKLGDINTNTSGSFNSIITVPASSTAGAHTISATVGTVTATATFTVTGTPTTPPPTTPPPTTPPPTTPPPTTPAPSNVTVNINPTSGHVGGDLLITGIGFASGKAISIKYDDSQVATATADANGLFVTAFKIPASGHGDHTISVSDGTNTKKVTFTVASVTPKTPSPLTPEMGVTVKSPITFSWGAVTVDSPPVTYDLQVASDNHFSDSSLILEKSVSTTEYALTSKEELELPGQAEPYYWRIRASDAANNQSSWTGAGQFYVAVPFSLPSWALYTIIGLGGILLFAIGYLLGRRSGFNY